MKKNVLLTITVLFLFGTLGLQVRAQEKQKQKQQLWFCQTEKVKPAKLAQYYEVSKEIAELCKTANFSFSFYMWQTNDMNFELWTPIDSISDISKIFEAWKKFDVPEEMDKKFHETLESFSYSIFSFNYKYSFPPKNNVLIPEETNYCRWQEIQYQVGTYNELSLIMDKMMELQKEFGIKDNLFYSINGIIGFDHPNFILAELAENRKTFEENQENAMSKFTDEQKKKLEEINLKILGHANKYKMKELYKLPNLSYVKH